MKKELCKNCGERMDSCENCDTQFCTCCSTDGWKVDCEGIYVCNECYENIDWEE